MSKPAHILILDDDANLRKTLGDILRIKGFDPVPLETGEQALERVQTEEFAVALIDLRLEDMPGLDVLHGIRQRSPATECILVTGHASQATAIDAINAGVYSYVQKPFDVDQLAITIQRALEKHQAGQALKESEVRYRGLFEDSPISIWEEDFSVVKLRIEQLRRAGVTDFRAYFTDHPETVLECVKSIMIIDVNNTTLKLMHAAGREQLTGSLEKVTRKQSAAGFLDEFVSIAEGKTDFEWEGINYTLDGEPMTVNMHWSAYPGYKETLERVIVSLIDITERKQAEEELGRSLSLQRATLESTAEGILVIDRAGKVSSFNRRFGEMWNIPADLLDTKDDKQLLNFVSDQLQEPEKFIGGVNDLYERPEAESFDVLEFKGGRTFERFSLPQRLGEKIVGRVWSFRDVSVRRDAENKLAQRTEELSQQNEELTRLNERAERSMQRLVSMRTIDMAISGSFDVNIVLGIVLDQLISQLGIHATDILLFNLNGQTFKFAGGRGFRTRGLERSQYKFGSDLAWRLVRERREVEIHDLNAQPEALQRTPDLAGEGFISYIGMPLMSKGQIQGVLEVFQREPLNWDQEGHTYLDSLAGQAAIAIDNAQLFDHLQSSNTELVMAYDSTLAGWASALELRDKETEGHTRRVASLTTQLAQDMGLDQDEQVQIYRGALLHDIGKMGVPDSIVLKPGMLTEDEWVIMRKHPQYAFDMLAPIAYLRPALNIPHCHHEKWDGTGYPRGLKGENIPLAARIFAVMDVWDALTSDRPYRKAWSEKEAIEYIRQQSGIHFDPAVVKIVLETSILKKNLGQILLVMATGLGCRVFSHYGRSADIVNSKSLER